MVCLTDSGVHEMHASSLISRGRRGWHGSSWDRLVSERQGREQGDRGGMNTGLYISDGNSIPTLHMGSGKRGRALRQQLRALVGRLREKSRASSPHSSSRSLRSRWRPHSGNGPQPHGIFDMWPLASSSPGTHVRSIGFSNEGSVRRTAESAAVTTAQAARNGVASEVGSPVSSSSSGAGAGFVPSIPAYADTKDKQYADPYDNPYHTERYDQPMEQGKWNALAKKFRSEHPSMDQKSEQKMLDQLWRQQNTFHYHAFGPKSHPAPSSIEASARTKHSKALPPLVYPPITTEKTGEG